MWTWCLPVACNPRICLPTLAWTLHTYRLDARMEMYLRRCTMFLTAVCTYVYSMHCEHSVFCVCGFLAWYVSLTERYDSVKALAISPKRFNSKKMVLSFMQALSQRCTHTNYWVSFLWQPSARLVRLYLVMLQFIWMKFWVWTIKVQLPAMLCSSIVEEYWTMWMCSV